MSRDDDGSNIPPIQPNEKAPDGLRPQKLMDECRRMILNDLGEGLEKSLALVDDALFAQAEKAHNNLEQSLYFDTMREIRCKRSEITKAFHRRLSDNFRRFPPGPPAAKSEETTEPEPDEDSMTLLNTEAYEDTLQITKLSSHVQGRCHEALFGLDNRLAALNSGYPVREQDNPLAPRSIAESFTLAIEPINIHNRIKPDLYRLFEELVMNRLDDIYEAINTLFISNQVLPHLHYKANVSTSSQIPEPAPEESHQQPSPSPHTQVAVKLASIGTLLKHYRHQANHQQGEAWSKNQLLSALTRMQKKALEDNYHPFTGKKGASAFHSALTAELLKEGQADHINPDDEGSIRLVEYIFELMNQDNQLPDNYKKLVNQLALPWVQMSVTDQSLLQDASHPARELLDEIAMAADQFQDASLFARDLYRQSQKIVELLTNQPNLDKQSFQNVLNSFQQHLTTLRRKADIIEQHQIEAGKGQERLHNARRWARDTIENKTIKHQLLAFSQRFFDTLWSDVLTFQYLRHSNQNHLDSYQRETNRLAIAIWTQSQEALTDLHEMLANNLHQIGNFTEAAVQQLIAELHKETDNKPGNPIILDQLNRLRHNLSETHQISKKAVTPEAEAIIEAMNPGLWCDALNDQGEYRHWKLAWHSQSCHLFLFVDGSGQKTALIDKGTLGSWIVQGRITPLPDGLSPLMNRTLQSLNKNQRP